MADLIGSLNIMLSFTSPKIALYGVFMGQYSKKHGKLDLTSLRNLPYEARMTFFTRNWWPQISGKFGTAFIAPCLFSQAPRVKFQNFTNDIAHVLALAMNFVSRHVAYCFQLQFLTGLPGSQGSNLPPGSGNDRSDIPFKVNSQQFDLLNVRAV